MFINNALSLKLNHTWISENNNKNEHVGPNIIPAIYHGLFYPMLVLKQSINKPNKGEKIASAHYPASTIYPAV